MLVPKYSILIVFPGCASPQLTCPHSFIQQTLPFTQGLPRGKTPRLPSVKLLNNPAPLRRGSRPWGLPHCTSRLNGGRSPPRHTLFSGVTGHLGLPCLRRTAASLCESLWLFSGAAAVPVCSRLHLTRGHGQSRAVLPEGWLWPEPVP